MVRAVSFSQLGKDRKIQRFAKFLKFRTLLQNPLKLYL